MRALVAALIAIVASIPALAEDYGGKVLASSSTVKVLTEDGVQAEYSVTAILNTAWINTKYNQISLSQNGVMARCGDYLGQLAEDFSVTVAIAGEASKTATIRAASGKERKVSVYGMCQDNTNLLTQLSINVQQGGAGIEIK